VWLSVTTCQDVTMIWCDRWSSGSIKVCILLLVLLLEKYNVHKIDECQFILSHSTKWWKLRNEKTYGRIRWMSLMSLIYYSLVHNDSRLWQEIFMYYRATIVVMCGVQLLIYLLFVFMQEEWAAAPELFQSISSRKQISGLINSMLGKAAATRVRWLSGVVLL